MDRKVATLNTKVSVPKLIALWAFSECSLGGLLHAFQVPFSGFWLAAIAVTIICCMIMFSENAVRDILYRTGIAIAVKLALSPHSPLTAYVAVGFQGILGALIARLPLRNIIRFPLFGALALLESGIQKIIILTIVFGNNLWQSIDSLAQSLFPSIDSSFSFGAIIIYSMIYTCWGMIVGYWATGLPRRFTELAKSNYDWMQIPTETRSKNRRWKWSLWLFPVAYLLLVYWVIFHTKQHHAWMLLLRPVIIIGLWYLFLNNFLKVILSKLVRHSQSKNIRYIDNFQNEISDFTFRTRLAYHYANSNYSGINKLKYFISAMIYLICIYDQAQPQD